MKKITSFILFFTCLVLCTTMEAQNVTITNGFPYLIVNNTGADDHGGIIWRNDGANYGFTLLEMTNNKMQYQLGGSYQINGSTNAFSIDLDRPFVTSAIDGYVTIGPEGGSRLTMDNNELQAKNGGTTSTLYLNFWGGETAIGTGNNVGDIRIGSGNDIFVDNSTGNVGFGTSAPNEEVDIVAGDIGMDSGHYIRWKNGTTQDGWVGYSGADMWIEVNEAGGDIHLDAEDDLEFQTNDIRRMTITETGLVGIGSSIPNDLLTVAGGDLGIESNRDLSFYSGTGAGATLQYQFQTSGSGIELDCAAGNFSVGLDASGTGDIYFNTEDGNRKMTLTEIGRLGLGTSAPLSDMHIQDAGEVAGLIIERSDQNNYMNLLSGSTGNSFYFAEAKRFSIVPSSNITSTSPNNNNSLFMYGPDWSVAAQRGNTGLGRVSPVEKLDVNGCVRANCYITVSDRRLKSDINAFEYGLEEVKKLDPVSYTYNGRGGTTDGVENIGLIAQELQAVAPELVEEYTHVLYEFDEDGTQRYVGEETYLQVRDSEIKFMLMNSIKELAKENEDLKSENLEINEKLDALTEAFEELKAELKGSVSTNNSKKSSPQNVSIDMEEEATLAQNRPNPFNENTVISYYIPQGETGAHINFFSTTGKLLKTVRIEETGNGQLNLHANGISPGTYMYQLVTDGGIVGSKTMMLMK